MLDDEILNLEPVFTLENLLLPGNMWSVLLVKNYLFNSGVNP